MAKRLALSLWNTSFIWLGLGWVLYNWDLYLSPRYFLPHDNITDHFLMFQQYVNSLKYLSIFPRWFYNTHGGTWIEPTANSVLSLLPYKFIGYFLSLIPGISVNTVFKFSVLVLGRGFVVFYLGKLWKKLHPGDLWAPVLQILYLFGSIGIDSFHHEQATAILFFIPLLWITALECKNNPKSLLIFFSLFGLALNILYPQIFLVYLFCCVIFFINYLKEYKFKKEILFIGILFSCISASPLLFTYQTYFKRIVSPVRDQAESLVPATFEEYDKINHIQNSSFHPHNFLSYLSLSDFQMTQIAPLDSLSAYVSTAVVFTLLLLFWIPIPYKKTQVFLILVLGLCSAGIYGPMPRLFWEISSIFKAFRQWFYFLPLFNLHLTVLIVFTLKAFTQFEIKNKRDVLGIGSTLLILVLLGGIGTVHLIATIPPILFLLLKLSNYFDKEKKQRLLFFSISIWLLFSNIHWAKDVTDFYRYWMFDRGYISKNYPSIFEVETPEKYSERSLLGYPQPFFERDLPIMTPKGFPLTKVSDLWKTSGIQWKVGSSYVSPSKESLKIAPIHSGFEILLKEIPKSATALSIFQYQDGNWKISTNGSPWMTPLSSELQTIEIPLAHSLQSVRIIRTPSPWNYLIMLMWLPILVSIGYYNVSKGRVRN